jgi:glycosyltransferase involved in cell wall biosynthesis
MIYLVSTEIQKGKGGISTALVALREAGSLQHQDVYFVSSHSAQQKAKHFFSAFCTLVGNAGREDLLWLHCGNWFSILRKCLLSLLPKCKGAKIVFHFHAQAMDNYLDSKLARASLRLLCYYADGIVVLTPWWQQRFLTVFPELIDKIAVIANPLDKVLTQVAQQPCATRQGQEPIQLLAMSRLVEGKGFESAIASLEQLPEHYRLTIAGDGPLFNSLVAQTAALNLQPRVTFVGWVDYQQKVKLLEQHDIFLLPSKYDSFGMGFIEAMAFGLPVVALNYKATPDVVMHGETGILCDSDSPLDLALAVTHCVAEQTEMGRKGKKHVLGAFDSNVISQQALMFFKVISDEN